MAKAVLRVVTLLREAPVAERPNWELTRLISEIKAREGVTISRSRLSKVLRKKSSAGADRGTPWRAGRMLTAALVARPLWLTVEWLPKYALELNDIEIL